MLQLNRQFSLETETVDIADIGITQTTGTSPSCFKGLTRLLEFRACLHGGGVTRLAG